MNPDQRETSQVASTDKSHFFIWGISTFLLFVLFVLTTTGSSVHWYKQGAGSHYAIARGQGVDHTIAATQSHTAGLLYSAFTVCGVSLPITFLLSATLAILLFHRDKKYKAARWTLFFGICAMGNVFMAVAQNILSHNATPLYALLISTSMIWSAIGLFFLAVIGFIALMRIAFGKKQYQ